MALDVDTVDDESGALTCSCSLACRFSSVDIDRRLSMARVSPDLFRSQSDWKRAASGPCHERAANIVRLSICWRIDISSSAWYINSRAAKRTSAMVMPENATTPPFDREPKTMLDEGAVGRQWGELPNGSGEESTVGQLCFVLGEPVQQIPDLR